MVDYYGVLGISYQAGASEIKKAFRKLAFRYHPDRDSSWDAKNRFRLIYRAYETLSDPAKKTRYDLWLKGRESVVRDNFSVTPKRYTPFTPRYATPYTRQAEERHLYRLMQHYLPYFKWVCRAGLALTIFLGVDYLLPAKQQQEKVVAIENIYRPRWDGANVYVQTDIKMEKGGELTLNGDYASYFQKQHTIRVYRTMLLGKVISVVLGTASHKVIVSLIYGNLFFIPALLFLISLLGLLAYKKVDLAFSLSIVSALLFIIVSFLITFNP